MFSFPMVFSEHQELRSDWQHKIMQSETGRTGSYLYFSLTTSPVWNGLPLPQQILLALGSSERPKWSLQEEKESWLLRAGPRHKW